MKRAKINNEVAKKAIENSVAKPTPFFIKNLRIVRSEILDGIKQSSAIPESRAAFVKASASVMRAMQMINAFYRGKPLSSVESGAIDNRKFHYAMELAFKYMNVHAENVHNKAFKIWIEQNLIDMGYESQIVHINNRQFIF